MLYLYLKTCCGRCRWGSWWWGRWGRWGGGRAARRWSPGSTSSLPEGELGQMRVKVTSWTEVMGIQHLHAGLYLKFARLCSCFWALMVTEATKRAIFTTEPQIIGHPKFKFQDFIWIMLEIRVLPSSAHRAWIRSFSLLTEKVVLLPSKGRKSWNRWQTYERPFRCLDSKGSHKKR